MLCELDKTEGKTCILRSPLIPDTFNWTCLVVTYQLSSQDVRMTLHLLADDESIKSYTLLANESLVEISIPDLESISLQMSASRYLVSTEDYESAVVYSVEFLPSCTTDIGEFLCSKPNANVKYTKITKLTHETRTLLLQVYRVYRIF